ncbi:MAG: SEC-C metal-binding domain-containing protein [Myxococcota bacterium]|nr:SEC-C metal-binding domain-containing protein [Myxococcota bacterium]
MNKDGPNEHTTADSVDVVLEPSTRRQLGEDGLLVFWRDGTEPGQREGLVCILSMCPHPDCACQLVYIDGFIIDGNATRVYWEDEGVHLEQPKGAAPSQTTLDEKMMAVVDPDSGDTRAHPDMPDATDPMLVEWLASEMDGELLDVLHRFRARAKGYRPEGPRADLDLDELEKYHLAYVDDLLEGTRSDEYILSDRRYWSCIHLCPTPGCDCHEARIIFFDDQVESGDAAGNVLLDISGDSGVKIEKMTAESEPEHVLTTLWSLFEQRHDVGSFLRKREAQLKAVGETLWRPIPKPVRTDPKVGRNAPCPCGSGRKFKKCCLGKDDGSSKSS